MTEGERKQKIQKLEALMVMPDFWADKAQAQILIKELQELKDFVPGGGKYDHGEAVMTIFAGAGGDDAEDFAGMLFEMYKKYIARKGWSFDILGENTNDHNGYRNVNPASIGSCASRHLTPEARGRRLLLW
jgi:protein subunit release factor A